MESIEASQNSRPIALSRQGILLRALLLGGAGWVLNLWRIPILTEETPSFLLGGVPMLLSFLWLGTPAGVLTSLIALSERLLSGEPAGLCTLIYLIEAWVMTRLNRRTGSLIVAATMFWLLGGWIIDILVYQMWLGVNLDYLKVLFTKQLLNGVFNGLLVEVITLVPGLIPSDSRVRPYLFKRILLVAMIPVFVLAVLVTRWGYRSQIEHVQSLGLMTAGSVTNSLERFVDGRIDRIRRLARQVENGNSSIQDEVTQFHSQHPEFYNVGITDASGMVQTMSPPMNVFGQSLTGFSVSHRSYFADARDSKQTIIAPLLLGTLHVRTEEGPEPIILLVEPLFRDRQFRGILLAALDILQLQPSLLQGIKSSRQQVTVVDSHLKVVASTFPDYQPANLMSTTFPLEVVTNTEPQAFSYLPPEDSSREGQLGINLRYCAYAPLNINGWGVVVEESAQLLHSTISREAGITLLLFLLMQALAYLVAHFLSMRFSTPLLAVNHFAGSIAAGNFETRDDLGPLASNSLREIRDLRRDLLRMQLSLTEYRDASKAREEEITERFQATFNRASIGIAHVRTDGSWWKVNDRVCALLGWRASDLVGLHVDLHASTEGPGLSALLKEISSTQTSVASGETRLKRQDGSSFWVDATVSLVRSDRGRPSYYILTLEDLSE